MPAAMHRSDRLHRSDRQLHWTRRLVRRYQVGTPYPPPPSIPVTNRSPAAAVTESHLDGPMCGALGEEEELIALLADF